VLRTRKDETKRQIQGNNKADNKKKARIKPEILSVNEKSVKDFSDGK
jgi:hypothetical protein